MDTRCPANPLQSSRNWPRNHPRIHVTADLRQLGAGLQVAPTSERQDIESRRVLGRCSSSTRQAGGVTASPRGRFGDREPGRRCFRQASDLGRGFGKAGLEKRLGEYQEPKDRLQLSSAHGGYAKPSQKSRTVEKPEGLWESYQRETNPLRNKRARLLADLKKRRDDETKQQKLIYEKTKLSVMFDLTLSREQRF